MRVPTSTECEPMPMPPSASRDGTPHAADPTHLLLEHLVLPLAPPVLALHFPLPLAQFPQRFPLLLPLAVELLAVGLREAQPLLRELLRAEGVLLLLPEGGVDVVELVGEAHGGGEGR